MRSFFRCLAVLSGVTVSWRQGGKNFPNGKDSWNLYGGSWCEFLPKVISNTFLWFHLMILPITNGKNSWTYIVDGKFKLSHSFTRALSVVPGIFSNSMTHLMSLRPKDHGIEQLGILATGLVWELATSCLPFDTANPGNPPANCKRPFYPFLICFVADLDRMFLGIYDCLLKKTRVMVMVENPLSSTVLVGDFQAAKVPSANATCVGDFISGIARACRRTKHLRK